MIIISDTSPISAFIRIGRLDLLRVLYDTVTIPVEVKRELHAVPEQAAILDDLAWIVTAKATNVSLVTELRKVLDPGEAEAIALSLELNADALIIDERQGRKLAENRGILIVGVLGILVQAKQTGKLDLVAPEIHKLQAIGFRMHDRLIYRVLKGVQEM